MFVCLFVFVFVVVVVVYNCECNVTPLSSDVTNRIVETVLKSHLKCVRLGVGP